MQQTQNYKLNLIETSDPFSPAALNENTQKTEVALAEEAAARQAETAALDARLKVFEATKVVTGTYLGTGGRAVNVSLGFQPLIVIAGWRTSTGIAIRGCNNNPGFVINEDGFWVSDSMATNATYGYVAIG